MTPEERKAARAELRNARKAYINAKHTVRAAQEGLRFSTARLLAAANVLGVTP